MSEPTTGEIVRALRDAPNYNGMAGTTTTVEDIAADRLESQEQTIAALTARAEQERQWISVKDRLPDKTGKYLVFHHEWSDGAFLPTYEDYTIRTMQFMNNNKWRYPVCVDKRCEADTHREVTHWMPLPEPPMCGRPLKGENEK